MIQSWKFVLLALCLASQCVALEQDGNTSDVVDLSSANFEGSVSSGDWFIDFYSPRCPHCVRLSPTWEKLATTLKGKINVGKVDASQERSLARRFSIRGYPTLIFVHDGGKDVRNYEGSRSLEDLVKFAEGGWKSAEAPAKNPMSIKHRVVGTATGFLWKGWHGVKAAVSALQNWGVPIPAIFGLFMFLAALGLGLSVTVIIFIASSVTPKAKVE